MKSNTPRRTARQLSPLFTWRGAIADSALPASAKLLALTLTLHMSERGDSCFPNRETLMRETSLSRATVRRQIQLLEDEGWLVVVVGSGRTSSRYQAVVPEGCHGEPPHGEPPGVPPVIPEGVKDKGAGLSKDQPQPGTKVTSTRQRPRNVLFDALAEETQADPTAEGGRIAAALKVIAGLWAAGKEGPRPKPGPTRGEWDGVLIDEIRRRARLYRERWPNVELTPSALAKNWERVTKPRPGQGLTPDEIREEGRRAQEAGW